MNALLRTLLAGALLLALAPIAPVRAGPQAGAYLVTDNGSAADISPGDGLCLTAAARCSLRAAIQEANVDGMASTITFASAMDLSYPDLPPLTENGTTIDGSSRWNGAWPNGEPGVTLGGGGPVLNIKSDNNVIYGLDIGGGDVMLLIDGGDGANTIGGTGPGQRNIFIGAVGVKIQSSGYANRVAGNYFGTRDGLTPIRVGDYGVYLASNANFVEGNVIVAQAVAGVLIWNSAGNFIRNGNVIGSDRLRAEALSNTVGIRLAFADGNYLWDNFIAGNASHGVELYHADNNSLIQNIIGDGLVGGNGGDGVHGFDAHHNQIGSGLAGGGNSIGFSSGHGIWLNGSDNFILGNGVGGNGQDGIRLDAGQRNQIGAAGDARRNSFNGNGGNGVFLSGSALSNTVQGNWIGLADGAFDAGNGGHGIVLADGASYNRLGGLEPGQGNRIAWNTYSGLYLAGAGTQGNVVEGNVIGAPIHWAFLAPNGHHGLAVYDGAHHNWIGWNNTVLSNNWSGIAVVNANDNVIWLNQVGTHQDDTTWGNIFFGVAVVNGAGNLIFGNEIGFNGHNAGEAGVRIDGGLAGNPIQANSIHSNGGPGIELVNGGNFELGAPDITQASCAAQPQGQAQVQGLSCPDCAVEIFSDASDEGRVYEGTVTADGSGAFAWTGVLHGPNVTATATLPVGATSSFSAPYPVGACMAPRLFLPLIQR
ncbi:MAG: right-handed parallel beta-helix repeat-containing protein [Anaerolineales bacterium]|nr:right-handed parallel beta-helix repeat-containing protein [Anaerolineales bacterium]